MKAVKLFFAGLAFLLSTAVWGLDLNTADAKALEKLPGIGPAKAQAIVDYRTKNGPFKAKEDVKKVEGIGDKTYEAIAAEISVGAAK